MSDKFAVLSLLKQDNTLPNKAIAARLGLTPRTVGNRMEVLKMRGSIRWEYQGKQRIVTILREEDVPLGASSCLICQQSLANHLRCAGCTILIGPTHYAKRGYGDLCRDCALERQGKPKQTILSLIWSTGGN